MSYPYLIEITFFSAFKGFLDSLQKYGTIIETPYDDIFDDDEDSVVFIEHKGDDSDGWVLAQEISRLPEVISAIPLLPITQPFLGETNENDGLGLFNLDPDNEYNNYRWNITQTRFDDAVTELITSGIIDLNSRFPIAVLDTGFTDHPEILPFLDKANDWDFLDEDDNPEDPLKKLAIPLSLSLKNPGHGTAVSSIAVGSDTGAPRDFHEGVFPFLSIRHMRIAESVIRLFPANVRKAVQRALNDNCTAITMSMGGPFAFGSWRKAARRAYERGVVWTCAAGNHIPTVVYPARFRQSISCGGTTQEGKFWKGSSRLGKIDISAPAQDVFKAKANPDNIPLYDFGSGTSFATPHVASAFIAWSEKFASELSSFQGPAKIEAFRLALKNSASDFHTDSPTYGPGILDVMNLLTQNPSTLPEIAPSQSVRSPVPTWKSRRSRLATAYEFAYLGWEAHANFHEHFKDFIYERATPELKDELNLIRKASKLKGTITFTHDDSSGSPLQALWQSAVSSL